MFVPTEHRRTRLAAVALVAGLAGAALPGAAHAATVGLGTAQPFVVLGGQAVTNTGPSQLYGELGVSPGTSLGDFGFPAFVSGATHAADAVALQAQADLGTAYDVAAAEPVPPGNVLTGTDLGNRTLQPGAYRYASSAQLTGALTLDAGGDPDAQFIFQIGSTLTTAAGSSVLLLGNANPCNIFWQIGSSATIDTTTAFQGNVMTLADITLNNGASVQGRLLARNGGTITLINNVLDSSMCAPDTTTPPPDDGTPTPTPTPSDTGGDTGGTAGTPGTPGGPLPLALQGGPGGQVTPAGSPGGTAAGTPAQGTTSEGTATVVRRRRYACTDGFQASIRGRMIARVVFTLNGRRIATRRKSPYTVVVRARAGNHRVRARVTFTDATRAKTLTMPYRACAAALRSPRPGPSRFTG